MLVSPLAFFPLLYAILAIAMGFGAFVRWRGGFIHGWQFALSLLLKLVPVAAFAFAYYFRNSTGDELNAYLLYAVSAVTATVLGAVWVGYDLLALGVWRRDDAPSTPPAGRAPRS